MARRTARKVVRKVKNEWFQARAAEASAGRNGGTVVWKCIRDIQRSRRGMVSVRAPAVKDEDGRPCCALDTQGLEYWEYVF